MPNWSPKYIIIKTLNAKNKERILKTARERDQVPYKGRHTRLTPGFSIGTESWKVLGRCSTRSQPRQAQPTKLTIRKAKEKEKKFMIKKQS